MTRAERLDALLAKHAPKSQEYFKQHGMWPGDDLTQSPKDAIAAHQQKLMKNDGVEKGAAELQARTADASKRSAPYVISTRKDGQVRLTITTEDGSVIGGQGKDLDEALSQIEAKEVR